MLPRFYDVIQDPKGNVLSGATVTIKTWQGADAILYANRDGSVLLPGNILTSDLKGQVAFFAPSGYYSLHVEKAGYQAFTLDDVTLPAVDESLTAAHFGIPEGASDLDITTNLQDWIYHVIEHSSGVVASGRLRCGIIDLPYGNFVVDSLVTHPAVSFYGRNRAGTKLKLKNDATPVGPDNVRAMFYILARTQEIQATGAWSPEFRRLRLSGNKGNQSNQYCYGIYCEKGENDPHYTDYLAGGTELKSYSAIHSENTEIEGFSGTGLKASGDRQRLMLYGRFRSINHGIMNGSTVVTEANGIHVLGNDPVISDCGFGGCTGHSVLAAGCSGVLMHGNNVWGTTSAARSRSALALHLQNTNGSNIVGNTFNDTVSFFGGDPNNDRSFSFVGNHLKPNKAVFSADGVPVGTGDEACNAFVRVRGYRNAVITGNDYNAASDGRRYKWLASFTDDAVGGIDFTASTETAVDGELLIKPWATTAAVPIYVSGNSAATFAMHDAHRDMHRFSGNVVIDMNPNNEPDVDTYSFIHAGSKPALLGNRVHMERGLTLIPAKAQAFESLTNSANYVVAANRQRVNFYSNGMLDAATVVLPAAPDNGHELELYFRNGVKSLMLQPGDEAHQFFDAQIVTAPPETLIRFTFKVDEGINPSNWWLTSTSNRGKEPYAHKFVDMTNSGSLIMESNFNQHIHLRRTGLCTAFTVTLPSSPQEGEKRRITLHQGVTAWALEPNTGQVLHPTDAWPTTIPTGGFTIEAVFHITSTPENVWYLTRASA